MAEENWQVLNSETVLQSLPFLQVDMQRVQLPDGSIIDDWPILHTRDYANVFVLNEAGEALLMVGYKHGIGRVSWQTVGGYLEPGEDPLHAVQRELMEETGYGSEDWQPLGSFVVDANRHTGTGHFFLARRAWQASEAYEPDTEGAQVLWVPVAEVRRALQDGRVVGMAYALNIALALLALGVA